MNRDKGIKSLKQEFINTLTLLNGIAPIRFINIEDGRLSNFRDIVYDEESGEVHIKVSETTDGLPSHRVNPLLDKNGKPIPYVPIDIEDDANADMLRALFCSYSKQGVEEKLSDATIEHLCYKLTGTTDDSVKKMVDRIYDHLAKHVD